MENAAVDVSDGSRRKVKKVRGKDVRRIARSAEMMILSENERRTFRTWASPSQTECTVTVFDFSMLMYSKCGRNSEGKI